MDRGRNKKWLVFCCIFLFACKAMNNAVEKTTDAKAVQTIPFHPLRNAADLDVLINEIGNSRVVLLGESTHGTHEYYEWRAAITKRLIEEKGFNFIAVEGDWVDSYKVDQFIKAGQKDSNATVALLREYDRWPSSMWSNYEMASLVQWLSDYNQKMQSTNKIGFYGLDVYSFWEWTKQSIGVTDTAVEKAIKKVLDLFSPYKDDALKYSAAVRQFGIDNSKATGDLWKAVQHWLQGKQPKDEAGFLLQQQSLLAVNGEKYFRTMVTDKVQSWNIRDSHMAETVKRLLNFYGRDSKAIIWVHNGHAGNAHYSQMAVAGYTSVGEILRNELGQRQVFATGFGTDKGEVTAGKKWYAPLEKCTLPPAKKGSWENILHEMNPENKILLSKEISNNQQLNQWISFRSVGAAYSDNAVYGSAIVPRRFDAFVFIDSTTASHPIPQ
jgi:erythromycin esterase-like protein